MGRPAKHRSFVIGQGAPKGPDEGEVGRLPGRGIQKLRSVLDTTVSVHDVMRELEGRGAVWPHACGERDGYHGGFKVDEMQWKAP